MKLKSRVMNLLRSAVVASGQIIGFIRNLKSPAVLQSKTGMEKRDVLVGTLRNHSQLEICIKNKFYHIPAVRLAPEDFPVHYVAIYQSNYKFGLDAGVRYWGKVEKCSLVPRYKITEIPKNSHEQYYRFDINEWKKLDVPITTREGDFVNMMTTRFLLENSREIPELMLRSESERELYLKIRGCISGESFERKIEFCGAKFIFDGGKITVTKGKKAIYACTYTEYSKHPSVIFRQMISLIQQ